tara:strand:+ start:1200 stop:1430 length:231 start_codon:yes stop_codon:yes gene_type:complete
MGTYYSYVDSDNHPHIFDEDGNPDGYKIDAPTFDFYDQTWDYGVQPVDEDWEFTDYDEISRDEYVNAITKEEKSGW